MKIILIGLLLVSSSVFAAEATKAKRRVAQHGTGNVGAAFAYNVENGAGNFKGPRLPQTDLVLNPARIDSVTTLVNKTYGKKSTNLQIKVVVHSTGGSTDLSPQKQITFGIYSENEMFDVIAAYNIGHAYSVKSAKRVSGGVYEVEGVFTVDQLASKKTGIIRINAIKAINELENVKYNDDGSDRFPELKSEVTVTPKS